MIDNRPVVFFDSGIGGLPYLKWARENLPSESFLYLADNLNFPYGEKSSDQVKKIVIAAIGRVIERFNPKLAVIACNTAAVTALTALRETFSIPFVGVVPAIKPAAERSGFRRIGLLATSRTVSDLYTQNLIDNFASNCSVIKFADGAIVNFVESRYFDSDDEEIKRIVFNAAELFNREKIDYLIMGCTHFIYIEEALKDLLPSSVVIIDSVEGVGKQIIRVLNNHGIFAGTKGEDRFFLTNDSDAERYKRFASYFNLAYSGKI